MARNSNLARWFQFNLVGLLGVGLQTILLFLFAMVLQLHYLLATFLAVETTILHNFAWHHVWTWRDRPLRDKSSIIKRLLHFNGTTGGLSLVGNLVLMQLLVEWAGLPLLAANLTAIAFCSLANFLISHHFVFRTG